MPRNIDLTGFSQENLEALAQHPGPTGNAARQYLARGGKGSSSAVPQDKGNLAYNLLTDEQKATVDTQVATADSSAAVAQAVAQITSATAALESAAITAQAVIDAAPDTVDTTDLEQAVAAVQPLS